MGRKIDDFLSIPAKPSKATKASAGAISRDLEELRGELKAIKESIDKLQADMDECKRMLAELLGAVRQRAASPRVQRRSSWGLRRILKEVRFVMASEAKARLGMSPQKLRSEAIAEGLVVVEAGGDFAVMTRDSLEEFKALLASLNTADPAEAARELGEYGRLFQALRDGGQVYYDARKRRWVMLWE
jgi:uncharacterized protein YdhG (YjbR/CyaY superfamily)